MSLTLRIFLIVFSFLSIFYIIRKIRKSSLRIDISIFWIVFAVLLIVLSIFPGIAMGLAKLMGVISTVNLIYLFMIFILLLYAFSMTLKMSELENKINELTEEIAIKERMTKDKKEKQNVRIRRGR
ncbi:MAG: DUF2304 domain-containing protein [Eubacterium sp.]|nr:DUF2304 domain-containing protein [Eubacterium sp.]